MRIEISNKQLLVLKSELECLICCKYECVEDENDKEEIEVIKELLLINNEVCKTLEVEVSSDKLYQRCLNDPIIK